MISVIVSTLSLFIVITVTVALVGKSYADEAARKSDMRKVVDQVNDTIKSSSEIENKQNTTMTGVNKGIVNLQTDVADVRKTYVPKAELAKDVTSAKGTFDDAFVKNKFGVGVTDVKYGMMDVNGAIYAKDGLVGVVGDKTGSILGADDKYVYLNKDKVYPSGVKVEGEVRVGDNLILDGTNQWILHTPDDGRQTMYIARHNGKDWDWNKNITIDDRGYASAYGGGLNTRGGSSKHNPHNWATHFPWEGDGKNYIRGDTELRGDMNLFGKINMANGDPGPMIERNYAAENGNNRYGVGQYPNGTTRLYAGGGHGPATVNLSIARDNGAFDDVVRVGTDKKVHVNGEAHLNANANYITRHIDAKSPWGKDNGRSIFAGWFGDKVVLGNNANAGHDYAANTNINSIISTNPHHFVSSAVVNGELVTNTIKNNNGDWLRVYGTPNNGIAVYNGMSINDGGGLAVGKWEKIKQGDIWASETIDGKKVTARDSVYAKNSVSTDGKLSGGSLCLGAQSDALCLQPTDVTFVKNQIANQTDGIRTEGNVYAKAMCVGGVNSTTCMDPTDVNFVKQQIVASTDKTKAVGGTINQYITYDASGYLNATNGGINIRGGTSKHNPSNMQTHLPWANDGKNYIRGDTELRGDMNLFGKINMANSDPGPMIERNYAAENGNDRYGLGQYPNGTTRVYAAGGFGPATVNLSIARDNGAFDDVLSVRTNNTVSVNGDLSVQKKITFKEMGDNTDPYYLEKINNGDNNSHLRLTINDDADESFQIWGDSCSTGNCGGPGVMRHMFKADGDAEHRGNLKVAKNIAGKNVYASALCIGDEVNNVCLRKEELSLLKQQLALTPVTPSSTTTTLTSKIIEGIPGLVGFYVAENFTGGKWVDASTAKNDVVTIKGAPTKVKSPLNNRDMISFTFNDGMTFPAAILPQTYTLFHLARLKQGGKRRRVFDGKNTNWLSGFWEGNTGVAYHNAWVTPGGDAYGNNWIVSIDQNDMYIANNTNRTLAKGGTPSHANLTINDGLTSANETSDCDVACVIVFNRTLTQNEYSLVSDEIFRMYGL